MSKYTLLFLLVVSLLSSCKEEEVKQEFSWDLLKFKKSYNYLPASLVFDESEMVPLVGVPEGDYLTDIVDVEMVDDYFIVSMEGASLLKKFDRRGNFILAYGANGVGPGEYNETTSFTVDKENDRVFLYDQWQAKVLIFSLDGSYIGDISEVSSGYIYYSDDKLYLFRTGNPKELDIGGFEPRLEIRDGYSFESLGFQLPVTRRSLNSQAKSKVFYKIPGDTTLLHPPGSFELIYLKDGKVVKHIEHIETPAFPTREELEMYVDFILYQYKPFDGMKYLIEKEKILELGVYIPTGNKTVGVLSYGFASLPFGFADGKVYQTQGFFDDLTSFQETWKLLGPSDDYLIGVINTREVQMRYIEGVIPSKVEILKTFMQRFPDYTIPSDFEEKFTKVATRMRALTPSNDEPPPVILLLK